MVYADNRLTVSRLIRNDLISRYQFVASLPMQC